MKHFIPIAITGILLFSACGGSTDSQQADETTEGAPMESASYEVTPFGPSASFPDATLTNVNYKDGKFSCQVGGKGYSLGVQTPDADQKGCANSDKGQHIHLIVDNGPYLAKYESEFEHQITDGEHHILAFLSRSYHESIKTPTAFKAIKATVENGSFKNVAPIEQPMLFYSRPKGLYEGDDTKKVMLDYYMVNCSDATHSVKAEINGEEFILDKWQPYAIEGLEAGENQIKLTLVTKDGEPVITPLNPVTRKFQLNPEPPANM